MFVFTNRPAGGQDDSTTLARWLYPCALCNELECEVAGTLCPACDKPRKRAAASTRGPVRKPITKTKPVKASNVVELPKRGRS
jgi:hypothetical protein